MPIQLTTTRSELSGNQETVCHFDELTESAQDCLVEAVDAGRITGIDPAIAMELVQYDLIKFVDYFSVQIRDNGTTSSVSA